MRKTNLICCLRNFDMMAELTIVSRETNHYLHLSYCIFNAVGMIEHMEVHLYKK